MACVEVKIRGSFVLVKISGSFVFLFKTTAERRPSSGERYLRCFVKTGVNCSIEFSFSIHFQ